jgi:hypothetical protein
MQSNRRLVSRESKARIRKTPSTRLVSVRDNLRQKGFSETATKHISRSVRESTNIVYDAKWTIFSDWCVGREIDPFKISVQQLADFLVFLFEVKGLAPSTVKGYRSAISRTIHISGGEDFGNNQFISLLVRNFSLESRFANQACFGQAGAITMILHFSHVIL